MGNIIINIQEKNASEGARNTVTAYDERGNELGRDEINKITLELPTIKHKAKFEDKIVILKGLKRFCIIDHLEKDDIGRIRPAMVFWDKDVDITVVEKCIKDFGLNMDMWEKLEKDENKMVYARLIDKICHKNILAVFALTFIVSIVAICI